MKSNILKFLGLIILFLLGLLNYTSCPMYGMPSTTTTSTTTTTTIGDIVVKYGSPNIEYNTTIPKYEKE